MRIIAGEFKMRTLFTPKGEQTRPSKSMLRETFFNICAPYIEGAVFADLFAGSGAIGLEALSRGAKHVYFIENHKNALAAIEKNIQLLKVEQRVTLLKGDVFTFLPKIKTHLDIIFADPPYAKDQKKSFAIQLLQFLNKVSTLTKNGKLFLETRKGEAINFEEFKSFEFIKSRALGDSQLIELKQIEIN